MTLRAARPAALAIGLALATGAALFLVLYQGLRPPNEARASDPGHWTRTATRTVPPRYYQGIASDRRGRVFFSGVTTGLYRTDRRLRETARRDRAIPRAVAAREGYDHIGDISWDRREGGRVLLPLECYDGFANTCSTGAIGVADDDTLAWRYYVKLDPREIAKAMWAEAAPDGELLWTQSRDDLLAYDMDHVTRAHAAPRAAPIRAVRRLRGAVPRSGITGAAFLGRRLFVAGQDDPAGLQVWSIDPATGAKRLEVQTEAVGESEGIDFAAGVTLRWLIAPYGSLLQFAPGSG